MTTLTPYIKSEDARAQAEFYTQALGGEILSVVTNGQISNATEETKDKVIHLSLVAGGINLFMSEFAHGPISQGNSIALSLEFATEAEAREGFDRLAAGGDVLHPMEPSFWGPLFGELKDKYGVVWMITHVSNASPS
jgi:PhnB protein